MSKILIEVENEQIDAIVRQDLNVLLECLQNDLERVKEHDRGYVFHTDPQEDAKEIQRHIRAFKRVLRYYGEKL